MPHFGVFGFANLTDLSNVTNSQKDFQSLLVSICYLSYAAVYFTVGCGMWSPAFSKKCRRKEPAVVGRCNGLMLHECVCVCLCALHPQKTQICSPFDEITLKLKQESKQAQGEM